MGKTNAGVTETKFLAATANKWYNAVPTGEDEDGSLPLLFAIDTGSVNTYAVSMTFGPDAVVFPQSLMAGLMLSVKISNTCTGSSTLNVNGTGAKTIKTPQGNNVALNDLAVNRTYDFRYDGTNFIVLNREIPRVSFYSNEFDSLHDAITDIGATPATLTLVDGETLTKNDVIPVTLNIVSASGGVISPGAGASLGTNPFATTNLSKNIVVTHVAHGMVSRSRVVFAGSSAVNGIPAAEINREHVVTYLTANSYRITARSTAATSTGSGGGASVTSPFNLYFAGWLDAGLHQVFDTTFTPGNITLAQPDLYVEWHNVKADGNATTPTDNATELQFCLDNYHGSMAVMNMIGGHYGIASGLSKNVNEAHNTIIKGNKFSRLTAISDSTAFELIYIQQGWRFAVYDLMLEWGSWGLILEDTQLTRVEGCDFFNSTNGLKISEHTINCYVEHNDIHEVGAIGMLVESNAKNTKRIHVNDNNFSELFPTAALIIDGCADVHASDNNIVGKVIVQDSFAHWNEVELNNNFISGGIEFTGRTKDSKISGGNITNGSGDGVLITSANVQFLEIDNCNIKNCSGYGVNNTNANTSRLVKVNGGQMSGNSSGNKADASGRIVKFNHVTTDVSGSPVTEDHDGVKFGSAFVPNGHKESLIATLNFTTFHGNMLSLEASGANRNVNYSGTPEDNLVVWVRNYGGSNNLVFDNGGLTETIAPGEKMKFVYDADASAWVRWV